MAFFKEVANSSYRWRYAISGLGLLWALSTALYTISKLAYILIEDIPSVIGNFTIIRSFLVQVRMGQVLLLQFITAILIVIFSQLVRSKRGFRFLLLLVVVGILPSALTGHSGNTDWHELAVGSWAVHIFAVSIWVALVLALLYLAVFQVDSIPANIQVASRISLFCFIGVIISGVVNAAVRMPSVASVFNSTYGTILIVKTLLFLLIGLIAMYYRIRVIPHNLATSSIFFRLLILEVILMGMAMMVGVVLSETKFPIVRVFPN